MRENEKCTGIENLELILHAQCINTWYCTNCKQEKSTLSDSGESTTATATSSLASSTGHEKQICRTRFPSLHVFQEVLLQTGSNLILWTGADAAY